MPSGEVVAVKPPPTSSTTMGVGVGGVGVDEEKRVVYGEEEYDEDLAQLDVLLHYVNNLSASLEFLAWENKRISTDLVPTLLDMYDALYARLSEGGKDGGGGGGKGEQKKEDGGVESTRVCSEPTTKENPNTGAIENGGLDAGSAGTSSEISTDNLYIREIGGESVVVVRNEGQLCSMCQGKRTQSDGKCECSAKASLAESRSSKFDKIEQEREPMDPTTPSQWSIDSPEGIIESSQRSIELSQRSIDFHKNSDVYRGNLQRGGALYSSSRGSLERDGALSIVQGKDGGAWDGHYDNIKIGRRRREHIYAEPRFIAKGHVASKVTHTQMPQATSGPTKTVPSFDPRKIQDVYRPLSSISSSSSSSSNSLPRGTPGTAVSFLAFAESLEDNDADHSDTEETTRRRDRTIKIRREKAQRTGSGDSGVQCSTISLPAPPTLRPRYCDPNLAYMDRIVLEILETEAVYVRDMREIIQGYLEYWRRVPDTGIAPHHIVDLFSNIEQIYAFNRGFLAELETCGVDPVEVARCFVRNNAGFSIYTHYCTNYPRTVSVLTELMRGEASVRAFRERQLALSHTLPLGSYLLKPVQRVLKYHLLLGNIVKHFKEDQPGYTEIWNALAVMTGMAQHINDMKRRHEHAVRVQEIQSLLYGWQFEDLTTYGELAAEGTFKVCGAKGLRHIFLFEKMILIAKKKEENILMYKTHILCSNLMLIESVPGEPLSFHIIPFDNPRLQYTLEARNLEQKREWTLQLKRVILENYSANIPAHARQLVMELGQSKPEDVAAIEGRSGGKRAHHAPEYLERRKMDRDRRRSSEGVLNTSRLRLRRPSRARKDKDAEKGSRSRSVSRTRDTEDEETDRKVSNASVPSSAEKPKLKISNMWGRRRSEPGIGSRESLSLVQASVSDLPTTPNTPDTPCLTPDTPCTPTQDIRHPSSCQACPPTPEASGDGLSMSDNEQDEEGGEDTENGENLEEIVSQLLQHNLQLQKLLLGKQRRQLARKKPFQYETSDTENEDSPLKSICKSYNGSDGDGTLRHEDMADYVEFYVNNVGVGGECTTRNGSTNVSSSECQSVYSSAMSVHQSVGELKSGLSSDKRSKPVRRSSSDLSCKKVQNKRVISNYDNLLNIWSSIRGRSPEKRQGVSSQQTRLSPAPSLTTSDKPMLHRAQSFSVEKCLNSSSNSDSMYESSLQLPVQPGMSSTINDSSGHIWVRDELRGSPRERPVTIAIYNSNEVSLSALEQYLNQPCHQGNTHERFPYETEDNLTDYSITPHMSMDNILSIHPEHKIYKPSNKSTIKNVFSKITSPRSKSVSEPSGSVFNLSVDSELDQKNMEKKASKMVYNMARQCSKTLKERIKQIRAEDDKPKSPIMENIYSLPIHKQGSSSIGARLAGTNELSDYAVPRIRLAEGKSRSELRPDSVLSSSSILTSSSSSSSTKLTEGMEAPNMANVEEETEENPESQACESDASADSYYERSFEAIESLETEIFRDSAIYSDPDENESPPSSLYQDKFPTSPHTKSTVTRKPTPRFTSRSTALSESTKASVSIESQAPKSPSKTTENNENKLLVLQINISSTSQPKKVPPPVPAKPDSVKGRKTRAYGNLIQQQLKNLEECSRFSSRDNQGSPTFDGLKTLDDRRRDLDVCQVRVNDADMAFPLGPMDRDEEEEFVGSRHLRMTRSPSLITPSAIIKSPITLSPLSHSSHHQLPITRSSSVPPRLSPGPSLTLDPPKPASLGTASPLGSERGSPLPSSKPTSPQLDGNAGEEPRMPRGWVRHVIGKLQAESDV